MPAVRAALGNLKAGVFLDIETATIKRDMEEATDLVMTGAYSRVRHPVYLGYSLILFGLFLLLRSTSLLWVSAVFTAVIFAFVVPYEERKLKRRFGDFWELYRGAVPSFLPRPGRRAPSLRIEPVDETSARGTND